MPIKRQFRAKTTVEETWTGVVCNACGKEGKPHGEGQYIPGGFHLIRLSGGFGDDFPGDGETLEAVICSDCMKKWANTWKNPPQMEGHGFSYTVNQATHTETGETWSVMNGVCWKGGEDDNPWKGGEDDNPGWEAWGDDDEPDAIPEWNADQFWRFYGPAESIWKHFKGNLYQVLYYPVQAPDGNYFIFYRPLYGDDRLCLRPVEMWREHIERDGYSGQRFTLVE